MRREKGSITVFSIISLLLITATVFVLLEGTRLQELRRFANLQTEAALESVFANYNSCLWSKYRVLGANQTQLEEVLQKTANAKMEGNQVNFLEFAFENVELESYTLLTDGRGSVFVKSVASYMKDNILYESAKEIYNQYEAIKHLMDSNPTDRSKIEEAIKEAEATSSERVEVSVGTSGTQNTTNSTNPMDLLKAAKRLQEYGILELVLKDTSKLSKSEPDFRNGVLERSLKEGTNPDEVTTDWLDRVLLQQYLLTYLSNFREVKSERALSYELEYLLGEKSCDIENLKVVVTRILAIREAANFLYLISNPAKVLQAETMATLIGGTSLNPVVIEIIKVGLLTAWALAESILDVRALLAGKHIPLLKSEESWTLELENIGKITQEFCMAKESILGLTYENYLGILLLFEEEQSLAMKTMNIQEATIQKEYGDSSFHIDTLITHAKATISYTYDLVFPFLEVLNAEKKWEHKVWAEKEYGYY